MKIPKIYPHRRDGQELRGRERSQKSESFFGEIHENSLFYCGLSSSVAEDR